MFQNSLYSVKITHIVYEVSIIYVYHKSSFSWNIIMQKIKQDIVTHSGLVTS